MGVSAQWRGPVPSGGGQCPVEEASAQWREPVPSRGSQFPVEGSTWMRAQTVHAPGHAKAQYTDLVVKGCVRSLLTVSVA